MKFNYYLIGIPVILFLLMVISEYYTRREINQLNYNYYRKWQSKVNEFKAKLRNEEYYKRNIIQYDKMPSCSVQSASIFPLIWYSSQNSEFGMDIEESINEMAVYLFGYKVFVFYKDWIQA